MLKKVHVKEGEIKIGKELPWPVYDAEETLLLQEKTIITSKKQLNILLEKGLYRGHTQTEIEQHQQQQEKEEKEQQLKTIIDNPFVMKVSCAVSAEQLLQQLAKGKQVDVMETIQFITKQIRNCCKNNANATLAAIHLSKGFSYAVLHPLHTAILCELLMSRLSFTEAQEQTVMAAALTMNVGMHELQDQLFSQTEPLTDSQKQAINAHPEKSVSILENSGITDKHWLTIIKQHHERINGEGYPSNLKADNIHQGAKVVALADMYAAMITPRAYREPVLAQKALKDIFNKRGKTVDDQLAQMLIREVGVYPPGSFVKLANGDIAIVIKRAASIKNRDTTLPTVCSIISPRGGFYKRKIMRDPHEEIYKIIEICQPDIDEPINYPELWGYF